MIRSDLPTICAVVVAGIFGGMALRPAKAPAPKWTARIAVAMLVEPVPVPEAEAMPQPVEHPATGAYCLPRPMLAEMTHLCRDEGGEIEL